MTKLIAYLLRYGVSLVFLNVFLEQIGAPLPAVPTLIVAGAMSRSGKFTVTSLMFAAVTSSLIADYIWFALGRRYGYRILRTLCRISLSPDSCVRETEARFTRWGMRSLIVAKFIPGFSTVAPPLAGATGSSTVRFLLYDAIGAFIWAGASIAAGRAFFRAIDRLISQLENLGWWALLFIGALFVLVILFKWYQRLRFYRQLRMARVTVDELQAMVERGELPLIVDVRSASARVTDGRRIPGAIVADIDDIGAHVSNLPLNQEIILYCT
jgi:membrane protein DedA with SNARE-associated domain